MSSLRHILPGIAEHYRISDILSPRTYDVLHSRLGHSQETGDRMYARAHQDHPQLTNSMAHRTMLFCDLWQELLGFGGEVPNEEAALSLQESYTRQRSSSRKSLSLLWKTPSVEAISDPLPLHSYQDFQDRLVSMERSLTQLNNTVTSFQDRLVSMEHSLMQLNNTVISIAQALLPSIAAPRELLPQLRQPLNSDASIRAESHASQGDSRRRQTHDTLGDLRHRNDGASSTSRIIELKQQKTAASHRNITDDKDQAEEHPLQTMRSASVQDNSDVPEDIAGVKSHFNGGHAESEARQDNVHRTYCPKCDINIMGSDSERHAHFTNAKLLERNSDDGYWHVFCFTATESEALLGPKVRIYRGPDFKFICPCGEFSHYERAEVEAHLASFNADDQGAVTKHKKFRRRPGWTRG
ncbi:hypothetical protein BDR04DRAFT_1123409 [Suillus decipiens]|nr:hypothetical protein BDR04DRAFT_1123409 [Suillus decipiens]